MDEEDWDAEVSTAVNLPKIYVPTSQLEHIKDENNNSKFDSVVEPPKRTFGFGKSNNDNNYDDNKSKSFANGGFRTRDRSNRSFGYRDKDSKDDSSKKNAFRYRDFSQGNRYDNDKNYHNNKFFGQRFRDQMESNRGFNTHKRENNNQHEFGERRGFFCDKNDYQTRAGFGRSFASRNDQENLSNQTKAFCDRNIGFGNRSFRNNNNYNNNNENKEHENWDRYGLAKKGNGFGNKTFYNNNYDDDNDDDDEDDNASKYKAENRSRSSRAFAEKSFGFGGARNKDYDNNNKNESSGFGPRSFDNHKQNISYYSSGGFGRKNVIDENERKRSDLNHEQNNERRSFYVRNEKSGTDSERKQRYIPKEVPDTEESLFHKSNVGTNFNKQNDIPVNLTGRGAEQYKPIESFVDANLSDLLLENIRRSNYETPTPVQKYSIPIMLEKRDLMACAQTGSGKTAAFLLPIMKNILHDGILSGQLSFVQEPQALILSPTRELALQTYNESKKFSYGSVIKSAVLYGCVDFAYQMRKINEGCNILIATPGRLMDALEKSKISLAKVKYFVLDEADRMLDAGFEKDIRTILEKGKVYEKGDRCTFMFSATFPKQIQQLAQDFLHDYLFLTVGTVGGANNDVKQLIYNVDRLSKRTKLIEILQDIGNEKIIVFIEQKKQADYIALFLVQSKFNATSIHGDRFQSQRETALNEFKAGFKNILVATNVAARGLDIDKVQHVINYDMPNTIEEYVHRIGRTGRCGNTGRSISFFDKQSDNDLQLARQLVRILTNANQEVPEWLSKEAENSLGSKFTSAACADDLRSKFSTKMSLGSSTNHFSSAVQSVSKDEEHKNEEAYEKEEEFWD